MSATTTRVPAGSQNQQVRRRASGKDSPILSADDFEALVREYTGRLLVIAKRFLRSDEDAAEAVQDALLSAFASRRGFQGNSTPYTWLYRIVVNTCLMKIRSRRRSGGVSIESLLPTFDEQGYHIRSVSRRDCGDHDPLVANETRAVVRSCIDQLPDDFRTILLLRDIEELETEETAVLLQLSRSAVKTRLHRARQALRTLLEPMLL